MGQNAYTLPALVPDMPEEIYHGELTATNGFFNAGAGKAIEDECGFRALVPFEGSKDTLIGLAVHAMVDAWKKGRAVRGYYPADGNPDPARGEKLTKKQWEQAEAIFESLLRDPVSAPYLHSATDSELTALWEADGVKCKARIDLLCGLDIVDIKTAKSINEHAFRAQAKALGYAISAAHYLSAPFGFRKYIFLAVEKSWPYLVRKIEYSERSLEVARKRLVGMREKFRRCYESAHWDRYSDDTLIIEDLGYGSYCVEEEEEEAA